MSEEFYGFIAVLVFLGAVFLGLIAYMGKSDDETRKLLSEIIDALNKEVSNEGKTRED